MPPVRGDGGGIVSTGTSGGWEGNPCPTDDDTETGVTTA
jgi:hypothetical protein